jgi:ATP-dependent DNA helicase RecG
MNRVFFELAREGIVNALVHRDYEIGGAKCHLVVSADSIVIRSPGKPMKPITIEQLQSLEAPTLSRNPLLHFVFAKMKLAEERGLGLKSMRDSVEKTTLPLPQYSWNDPYVELKIYRSPESVVHATSNEILQFLSAAERTGWEWLVLRSAVTSSEYKNAIVIPERTAQNHLKRLTELGLLRKVGSGPKTRYEIVLP